MTNDFLDDLSDALDREKRGYLLVIHHGLHAPVSGTQIRTDFDNWPAPGGGDKRAITKEHDVLLAIAAALSDETQEFVVTRRGRRE